MDRVDRWTSPLFAVFFVLSGAELNLSVFTSGIIVLIEGWNSKKPIFGSKKYKYGEPPLREDCIPLFHRKKYNRKIAPSEKRLTRKIKVTWCVFFLLFACLFPFGLFGRNVLFQDNHIERINAVNLVSDTYTAEDYSHLTITIEMQKRRWIYEITIEMEDGKTCSFSNRDFKSYGLKTPDVCLDKMLEIKAMFSSESITIEGAKNITKAANKLGFNESQKAKFYELFSI
jgi:hypothetical protein